MFPCVTFLLYVVNETFIEVRLSQETSRPRKIYGCAPVKVCNFIEKRFQHRSFPVKFAKFLRTPILKDMNE